MDLHIRGSEIGEIVPEVGFPAGENVRRIHVDNGDVVKPVDRQDKMLEYLHQQGGIPRRYQPEELFWPSMLET